MHFQLIKHKWGYLAFDYQKIKHIAVYTLYNYVKYHFIINSVKKKKVKY